MIEKVQAKGYDIQDFAAFMSQRKQGGNDINNFTFDEVLEVSYQLSFCASGEKQLINIICMSFTLACLFIYQSTGDRSEFWTATRPRATICSQTTAAITKILCTIAAALVAALDQQYRRSPKSSA